jgi:ergothioneine biosynthesis protein EgtB
MHTTPDNTITQPDRLHKALDKFKKTRETTIQICQPLEVEDYIPQPVTDVSPPKWHLAHTTWFFETFILKRFTSDYETFHPDFNHLFNSYYNHVGERVSRDQRGFMTRPTVRQVYEYRHHVETFILMLANQLSPQHEAEFINLLELGCQHEQQHQELLITDLKYIFYNNVIQPVYHNPLFPPYVHTQPVSPSYLPVEAGLYRIGFEGNEFCFDNEREAHQVYLPGFSVCNCLVSNGEYLTFIQDDGYQNFRHWLSEGWEVINREGWKAPLYWEEWEGSWHEFTLMGWRPIDLNAPVTHISFYEAAAFAAWTGKRLLTEFEWEVAAKKFNPLTKSDNTLDSFILHPLPAHASDNLACHQLFGDTWQWTNSAYLPYPGYTLAEGALGEYNGKFMLNQMVLRGSSCATPANHMRPTYRNFFPTNARWQFTGIRLAE